MFPAHSFRKNTTTEKFTPIKSIDSLPDKTRTMDLDMNDHVLNKEDEVSDRGIQQDSTSCYHSRDSYGDDTERQGGEDSAPPPRTEIEITTSTSPAYTSADESGDDEKEQYISERHAMIVGILRASDTLLVPDPSAAANGMTVIGTMRHPAAPAVGKEEAPPAKELHTEVGTLNERTLSDNTATLLLDNDTNSPSPSDGKGDSAPVLVDEKDSNTVGPPEKARRTTPVIFHQQPGAFQVEGPHLYGSNAPTSNTSGDATPSPFPEDAGPVGVPERCTSSNNDEATDLEQGLIAAACDTNGSTQTGFTAAVSSDLTILSETALEAVAVSPEEEAEKKAQMEQEIRRQIYEEAVPAQVMGQDMNSTISDGGQVGDNTEGVDKEISRKRKRLYWVVGMALAAIIVSTGLGLGLANKSESKSNSETAMEATLGDGLVGDTALDAQFFNLSTLEQVRRRGFIRCGVTEFGFIDIYKNDDGSQPVFEGFNVEQCRTMALAALGDPDKYEIVLCDHYTRFSYLTNNTIDIMTEAATHTMQRDIWVDTFQAGYAFTVPYFYSGLTYAGNPSFVDCADESDSFYGSCRNLKICVLDGSTHVTILRELIQGSAIVPYNGTDSLLDHLWKETCNVIAGEPLFLVGVKKLFLEGFSGENIDNSAWKMGSSVVSKEPLATVTRDDDPEWSTLANMVVNGMVLAEANNISKENAEEMLTLFANGSGPIGENNDVREPLAPMLVSLIAEFGNYGDLYHAHIESQIPKDSALNRPYDNDASTGLLYSIPNGNVLDYGPDPLVNGTLDSIHQRGHIICGVSSTRDPAFAREVPDNSSSSALEEGTNGGTVWLGFDVEFCRALSGSLFLGDKTRVVFVALDRTESFAALSSEQVDVVAGARVTLQANYFEPTTHRGYEFSPPYYYDNAMKDAFAFMTREDDVQWNSFVYWIVMATIFAEEEGITMDTAVSMPVVTLFGERLKQMYRDCISSVGSYAELYNNSLQEFIPRDGANRLNKDLAGPQMFPIPAI